MSHYGMNTLRRWLQIYSKLQLNEMEGSTLTWEAFLTAANELLKISERLNDSWKWTDTSDGGGYLHKTELTLTSAFESDSYLDKQVAVAGVPGDGDFRRKTALLACEYNVLYSPAYSCPVLYFNIHDQDGQLLTLDRVISHLRFPTEVGHNYLGVVSQTEHPILRTPYCFLHPCHTTDLMLMTENRSGNLLIKWLSCIAPIVRLEMGLDYAVLSKGCGLSRIKR